MLEALLKISCKDKNDSVATFINYETEKTYDADKESYINFMKSYMKISTKHKNKLLFIGEMCRCNKPLTFTFNLRSPLENTIASINDDNDILYILRNLQKFLRGAIDSCTDDSKLLCAVKETGIYKKDDDHALDICFLFPLIRMTTESYNEYISKQLSLIFDKISTKDERYKFFVESFEYDRGKNDVPLFLSSNKIDQPYNEVKYYSMVEPYTTTLRQVGIRCDVSDNYLFYNSKDSNLNNYDQLVQNVLILSQSFISDDCIDTGNKEKRLSSIKSFLSESSCEQEEELEDDLDVKGVYTINDMLKDEIMQEIDHYKVCTDLLSIWKLERFLIWEDWRTAGLALYDACDRSKLGLNKWIQFTNESIEDSKEDIPEVFLRDIKELCTEEWFSFKIEIKTMVSLAFIAREDSYKKYNEWHKNWCKKAMIVATTSNHFDVAVAFHRMYFLEFSCFIGTKTVWYCYRRGRLRESPSGSDIRKILSVNFFNRFVDMLKDILDDDIQQRAINPNKDNTDAILKITANIHFLLKNLKMRPFKQHVVSECADLFRNDNMIQLMDADGDLLGMPDGVMVVNQFGITIRKSRPEDFITKEMGTCYNDEYHWEDKNVQGVLDWSNKTFCNKELEDYWYLMMSSFLRGGNKYKKVFCLTGPKDNSKSEWNFLLEKTFGNYHEKLPASKFHKGMENPEGASPLMAAIKACRIVEVDEPSKSKPLRTDMIKFITSDSFKARLMYQDFVKIFPQFVMLFVANDPPPFDEGHTDAIATRFSCIPFLSTWNTTAPEDEQEQFEKRNFPVDVEFRSKCTKYPSALLWIIVQKYDKLIKSKNGLRELPAEAIRHTSEYWAEKDLIMQYLNAYTEQTGHKSDYIHFEDLYDNFKDWYRLMYPSGRIMNGNNFKADVVRKWGQPEGKSLEWIGRRLTRE